MTHPAIRDLFQSLSRDAAFQDVVSRLLHDPHARQSLSGLTTTAKALYLVLLWQATERNVIGDDVLTEGGTSLGKVADLVLLVGSAGELVGYQIEKAGGGQGYIPLPAQLSVSGVALVVPNITEEFVQDDLVGLGAAVDEFRARMGLT